MHAGGRHRRAGRAEKPDIKSVTADLGRSIRWQVVHHLHDGFQPVGQDLPARRERYEPPSRSKGGSEFFLPGSTSRRQIDRMAGDEPYPSGCTG